MGKKGDIPTLNSDPTWSQQKLIMKGFTSFKYEEFYIQRKNLFCEDVSVEEICKKFLLLYLYSSNQILDNFNFYQKFKGYDILVAYAVKANSNQAILRLLAKRGAGADVVYGEMLRAIKAGIPPNKIVFLLVKQN